MRTEAVTRQRGSWTPQRLQTLAALASVPVGAPELAVLVPATGEPLGSVRRGSPEHVIAAAARARAAQHGWAALPVRQRATVLDRFGKLVLARQDEILDLIQLENGKSRKDAFAELLDVALNCRYYAREAPRLLAPQRRRGVLPLINATTVTHTPKGLVTVISPWNYPLTLGVSDAIPALIAGNSVLVKPDQQTPFTTLWAARTLRDAGLPADVFTVVTGTGTELGQTLVEQADFLMFTGSTAVGRQLAAAAGQRLIDCSMELGGKNACLVLADAHLDRAVDGVVNACFSNTGQLCISIERLYINDAIWERLVPRLVDRTRELVLAHRLDFGADCGPLISGKQLQTVETQVQDALSKGATALCGARARPDLGPTFYEPTLLCDVPESATLFAEETFGPVVALYRVPDDAHAIAAANASRYGLNFSVWSKDLRHARAVAAQLQAGTVTVNDGFAATWGAIDAPMGGWKESGLGSRHGTHGLLRYTDARNITVQRIGALNRPPRRVSFRAFAAVMRRSVRHIPRIPGVK